MKVDESLASMKEIRSAMAELSRLMEVIDDVAYQTKLLALNASIEAAQAGNAGRGFAVVAVSIRQLSEQTIQAADEARKLFGAGTRRVDRGMVLSSETGEAFREIVDSVRSLADTGGNVLSFRKCAELRSVLRHRGQCDTALGRRGSGTAHSRWRMDRYWQPVYRALRWAVVRQ